MLKQRTLKSIVRTTGIGLHSGRKVNLILRPAAPNTGIIFCRTDLSIPVEIPISVDAVGDTRLASVLQKGDVRISTVEHLLSACAGLGIDNLYIEVDAEEIPIMDGSAAPFIFLLHSAGIEVQSAAKKFVRIMHTVEVRKQDFWVKIEPYSGFKLKFTIDFPHPVVSKTAQTVEVDFAYTHYAKEIARARTFGFAHEVEALRGLGLARGGGMDNAIVLDEYRMLNPDSLRYQDEFAKHKILDAIGDLYLIGHPILGFYQAYKSGHTLNNQLLRQVLHEKAYELITFDDIHALPNFIAYGLEGARA